MFPVPADRVKIKQSNSRKAKARQGLQKGLGKKNGTLPFFVAVGFAENSGDDLFQKVLQLKVQILPPWENEFQKHLSRFDMTRQD